MQIEFAGQEAKLPLFEGSGLTNAFLDENGLFSALNSFGCYVTAGFYENSV
jgi:hypothetical protein